MNDASGRFIKRDAALLWDLDNVTPGNRYLTALARTLINVAGPGCAVYAAGHAGVCRAVRRDLTPLGITVLPGTRVPNGADQALLHLASKLFRSQGIRAFLVASNDQAFARLPLHTEVIVLTLHPDLVSARLRARAQAVIGLTHPVAVE